MELVESDERAVLCCPSCGERLAHDQRYCLTCGERRGPLPAHISQLIAGIHEQGRRVATPSTPDAEPLVPAPAWTEVFLRAPRAAAVAVIATLSFGALVGSMAGGSSASTIPQIIVSLLGGRPPAAQTAAGGESVGGSGGSGGPATITVTNPAPSSPSGSGGSGSTTPQTTTTTSTTTTTPSTGLPPVKHVFLVMLSGEGYQQTFGHTNLDPYLAHTLASQGELLPNYYAVAGGSLANELAIITGQGPSNQTATNCPKYLKLLPGVPADHGQFLGSGCVYPKDMPSLVSQLTDAHLTWKVYLEDRSPATGARSEACRPAFGATDPQQPSAQSPYATWRNPFLYLGSVVDKTRCPKNFAPLASLGHDLKKSSSTPSFSYIVPNLCDDGSVSCDPTQTSPMVAADAFLKRVIPKIKRSPAYRDGGLIAITFDQAPQTGPYADQSSCCDNPTSYPNYVPPTSPSGTDTTPTGTTTTGTTPTGTTPTGTTPTGTTTTGTTPTGTTTTGTTPTGITPTGTTSTGTTPTGTTPTGTTPTGTTPTGTTPTGTTPTGTTTTGTTPTPTDNSGGLTNPTGGGGQVGLLLISPFIKPGLPDTFDYFNHFALLASIEKLFGLKPLGYAKDRSLTTIGLSIYNAWSG